MSETRNYILDEATANKKLLRMAYEIAEQNLDETSELILAGIRENGVLMAQIIARYLAEIFPGSVKVIELELNKRHPEEITVSEKMNFDDAVIILIDDVTNSGKTLLYALKPFLDCHPRKIQTLTLVERRVIVDLYSDHSQRETAFLLGMGRSEMERTMRSIRTKMADWRPRVPQRALEAA